MINLTQAKKAIEASEAKAKELSVAISVVIVDEHGTPLAMHRMDGAIVISPKFAQAKAYTSAVLGSPSSALGEFSKEGMPYYGINTLFGGELTPMAGGYPVVKNGKVIGAVGVGGSKDPQQDEQCAQEAVSVLLED